MTQRICKNRHWYDGSIREPGETFEVAAADVQILLALDHIERRPEDRPASPYGTVDTYKTRDMAAQQRPRRQTLNTKAA